MRIATRDRIWLLGGAVVALLLTFLTWQLLIKSQNDSTDSVKANVSLAQNRVLTSTHELNQLRADVANLAKYQAALAADQAALPADDGVPAFLRELHDAGAATGVSVVQLTVGKPTPITGVAAGSAPVQAINLSIVASGPVDNVTAFLKQLQVVQPRAVLITSLTASPTSGGQQSVSVAMEAFTTESSTGTSASS